MHLYHPLFFLDLSELHQTNKSGSMENKHGVYTYSAPWQIYAVGWSNRQDKQLRIAIGSSLNDYSNKVELLQFNSETSNYFHDTRLVLDHPYPATNLMFFPSEDTSNPDLIATSGDCLRLWEVQEDGICLKTLLNGNKDSDFNSPITSFDWATFDPHRVATCSIDKTCTIWDVEKGVLDTKLVAHDKEVYDVSWGGIGIFASASADGSVRVFDLRDIERSTIIYENTMQQKPLLRLEWNKIDPRFMATFGMDSNKIVILDIRFPTFPLMELQKHRGSVNAIAWSPHIGRQLCSVGDDSQALIWEFPMVGTKVEASDKLEPVMQYGSIAEINQVKWSMVEPNWMAIAFLNKLQLLKV